MCIVFHLKKQTSELFKLGYSGTEKSQRFAAQHGLWSQFSNQLNVPSVF